VLRRFFLLGLVLSSALVDVLGNVSTGAISVNGILTILFAAGIFLFLLRRPKRAWRGFIRIWPLSGLFIFTVLQCLRQRPSMQGFQNVLLLWIFIGCIVLVLVEGENELDATQLVHALLTATAIAAFGYGVSLIYGGLGTESFIGARSFALYSMLGIGLLLGRWVHGSRISLWLAVALLLLIALSLSRTCLVVGVLLFPLARMRSFSVRDISRIVIIGAIGAGALYYSVMSIDALRVRFLGNNSVMDFVTGDASLDTSGRLAAWILTLDSFSESPWLGKGPGTANDLNGVAFADRRGDSQVELAHPLNEYLRFLHDEGVLGLSLVLAGYAQLLLLCRKAYRKSTEVASPAASFYLGTFLAFTAVLLTMLTDNTASYTYVVIPLGILIGITLHTMNRLTLETSESRARTVRAVRPSALGTLTSDSQT